VPAAASLAPSSSAAHWCAESSARAWCTATSAPPIRDGGALDENAAAARAARVAAVASRCACAATSVRSIPSVPCCDRAVRTHSPPTRSERSKPASPVVLQRNEPHFSPGPPHDQQKK